MATWPSRTWQVGELVTAGMMNSLRDELNELHATVRPNGGLWTNTQFVAGWFAPNQGVWTVAQANVKINRWTQIGKMVIWQLFIQGSTVGGSPAPTQMWLYFPVTPVVSPFYTAKVSALVSNGVSFSAGFLETHTGNTPWCDLNSSIPPGVTSFNVGQLDVAFCIQYEALTL